MKQLTIGNIITASVSLYRQNFRQYLQFSCLAHLWLLVPLYGWGKYLETAGKISYLSCNQLVITQFPNEQLKQNTGYCLWLRYLINLLLILIFCLFFSAILLTILFIGFVICIGVIELFLNNGIPETFFYTEIVYFAVGLIIYICSILSLVYPYSFLFITDLIVVSRHNQLFTPCFKSIQLSARFSFQVLGIILLLFAITIPLINFSFISLGVIFSIVLGIIQEIMNTEFEPNVTGTTYIGLWLLFMNLFTMPLWQSLKAVVYYKMLCDRESFDIRLN